jgi:hypothetical protein
MRREIAVGFAVFNLVVATAPSGIAFAASLTRSNCWTARYSDHSERSLCFFGAGRVTMTNTNREQGSQGWSMCQFSGDYTQDSTYVIVTFHPNSGKCTNGALSPEFTAVCEFSGQNLKCRGSTILEDKTSVFSGTFD